MKIGRALVLVSALLAVMMLVFACSQPAPAPQPKPTTTAPTTTPVPKPTTPVPTATTPVPKPTTPVPTSKPAATFPAMKLKFASVYPPTQPQARAAQYFMDQVTARTGGAVTFTTNFAGALGAPAAHLGLLQTGVVDIIDSSPAYNAGLFPTTDFTFSFPFVTSDPDPVIKAFSQTRSEYPQWDATFTAQKVKVLANTAWGFYGLMSRSPVKTLDDLKGKKIAVVGNYFGKWTAAGGLVPVVMPAQDRYLALQQGTIDIDILPLLTQTSMKIFEVAKYYVDARFGSYSTENLFMNLDKFNALPPDLQKIFADAGKEAQAYNVKITVEGRDAAYATIKAQGGTVTTLSDTDIAKWASLCPDSPAAVADLMESKGIPGYAAMKRYQDLLTASGVKLARQWAVKK